MFYRENKEVVERCVRRALKGGSQASVDDITQDAFAVVMKTWPLARDSPNPTGYAVNVAKHLLLEYYRREQKAMQRFARIAEDEEEPADPSAGVEFEQVEDRLDEARTGILFTTQPARRLEDLLQPLDSRPKQRMAVKMHHAMGLTVKESAEQLGVNERTFRNNAQLGLARLRELYSSEPPEP